MIQFTVFRWSLVIFYWIFRLMFVRESILFWVLLIKCVPLHLDQYKRLILVKRHFHTQSVVVLAREWVMLTVHLLGPVHMVPSLFIIKLRKWFTRRHHHLLRLVLSRLLRLLLTPDTMTSNHVSSMSLNSELNLKFSFTSGSICRVGNDSRFI